MSFTPFTLDEANEICEDFEDLKDTEFSLGGITYLVEDIAVCPHPEAERAVFIAKYLSGEGKELPESYANDEYDVVLFVFDVANEADIVHMNIRTYALERGVGYNFPQHS